MKSNLNGKGLNRISSRLSQKAKAVATQVKKATTRSPKQTSPDEINKRIAEKAYQLFLLRGCQDGNESFDWSLAEDYIRLESAPKKKGASSKSISEDEIKRLTEQKAYDIFVRRGCQNGSDTFDWLVAEELVRLEKSLSN